MISESSILIKKTLRAAKQRYEERDSNGGVNSKKKKKGKKQKKHEKSVTRKMVPNGFDDFEDYARSMESWGDY